MKNKILIMVTIALGIAPVIHAMEYGGLSDKEPSDKSGKEEIIEIVEAEQAPATMLIMISNDGQEFVLDTRVAQESPHLAAAIKFKKDHNHQLKYESELSSNKLTALVQLLQLQHESEHFTMSDIDKIDAIIEPLTEQELSHLSDEVLNYFELPIAALYAASQLPKEEYSVNIIKQLIEAITPHKHLQEIIMKYYFLTADQWTSTLKDITFGYLPFGFSIQELIDFNKLPNIENGELNLSKMKINDLTGWKNIPHKEAVTSLNLNFNKISNLPVGMFDGFDNLKKFSIANNLLANVPEELGKLKNLEYLMLNGNKISDISPTAFEHLKNLITVYLARNPIPTAKHFFIPGIQIIWEIFTPKYKRGLELFRGEFEKYF